METKRPNILLITSDQQHWNTLGCVNPHVKTPKLDRLAAQGVRFDRACCVNPTCTPTRASIITGLYPSQHGAWTLGTKLPEHVPTLGGYLGDAGYRTALVGKAHFQQLSDTPESRPMWTGATNSRSTPSRLLGTLRYARGHGGGQQPLERPEFSIPEGGIGVETALRGDGKRAYVDAACVGSLTPSRLQ